MFQSKLNIESPTENNGTAKGVTVQYKKKLLSYFKKHVL